MEAQEPDFSEFFMHFLIISDSHSKKAFSIAFCGFCGNNVLLNINLCKLS